MSLGLFGLGIHHGDRPLPARRDIEHSGREDGQATGQPTARRSATWNRPYTVVNPEEGLGIAAVDDLAGNRPNRLEALIW